MWPLLFGSWSCSIYIFSDELNVSWICIEAIVYLHFWSVCSWFLNHYHASMWQYTFILTASKELPKQCVRYGTTAAKYATRKNVGVRMPDDAICQSILEKMDAPLISTRLVLFCMYIHFNDRPAKACGKQSVCVLSFVFDTTWLKNDYCSFYLWLINVPCDSVKWPKNDEWMIDPVVIADMYGPEVWSFPSKVSLEIHILVSISQLYIEDGTWLGDVSHLHCNSFMF